MKIIHVTMNNIMYDYIILKKLDFSSPFGGFSSCAAAGNHYNNGMT